MPTACVVISLVIVGVYLRQSHDCLHLHYAITDGGMATEIVHADGMHDFAFLKIRVLT